MNLSEAVRLRMWQLCEQNHITINGLAMLSGISQSTVNSIIDGTSKNPTLLTILRICLGLQIELKDFFDDEVFFDLDDE